MNKEDLRAVWNWIQERLGERTTLDGAVIIAICVLVLLASPLINWVAWAGIVYGVFTMAKAEWNKRRQ